MKDSIDYRIVSLEGDAKITLSGTARIMTPKGKILHEVNLEDFPPQLCPLFRSIEVKKYETVSITFLVDLNDLPGIGGIQGWESET